MATASLSGCVFKSSTVSFTHSGTTVSTRPLKYREYTQSHLEQACKAVREGLSVRRAAEEYQIPKSTIQDHISGKVLSGSKSGQRYLSEQEEEELVTFILEAAKIGFTRTRKDIMSLVQTTVNAKGKNITISSGWWDGFKKRHPQVSLRMAEHLASNRASSCTPDVLNNYFDLLEKTIHDNDLLAKPNQIFNCDETGMPLDPKPSRVLVSKGTKHPRAITTGNKTQITILACCNAAGYCLPPFVLFDRKALKQEMCEGEVPGTMYGLSDSGWITSELFELWFVHHFLPHAPAARPLLLMLDGHSSHYNPSVISKAAEEKIIIFCLPPHSSHETQPLDKGPFGPLKIAWKDVCHKFLADNPGKVVTRFTFSKLFHESWTRAMTLSNVQAGFRCTGIYPLDRNVVVPKSKEVPSSLAQRTGIKFIPLYSPVRLRYQSCISEGSDNDDEESNLSTSSVVAEDVMFTTEEEERFQRRLEEGYDITTDSRYNMWKDKQLLQEKCVASSHNIGSISCPCTSKFTHQSFTTSIPISFAGTDSTVPVGYTMYLVPQRKSERVAVTSKSTVLSKFISQEKPQAVFKVPVIPPKSCGKILTSEENRKAMEEKEMKKQEELRKKEERKEKRSKNQYILHFIDSCIFIFRSS